MRFRRRYLLGLLLPLLWLVPRGERTAQLVLATTTSTQDTGLMDALVPRFRQQTGIHVKVIAVGTGQALELGRRGDADVLLVHAPEAEKKFVAEGHGTERHSVFYNDFVVLGPASDPAGVRSARTAAEAFTAIERAQVPFISRGDDSGTHKKEQSLWKQAPQSPSGRWYLSAGAGMAEALRMASERQGYTLSDRGTFLALRHRLELRVLFEGDPSLRNPYAVIPVHHGRHPQVNHAGATQFATFLAAPDTQRFIADFGRERYGEPFFYLLPPSP